MTNTAESHHHRNTADLPSTTAAKHRSWRWLVGLCAVALLLASLGVGAALWQLRSQPDYWIANQRAMAARTPEQTRAMADSLEADMRQWFSAAGKGGDRKRVKLEDLNAWLEARGTDALRRLGAPGVDRLRDPMVSVEDGALVLAGEVRVKDIGQVLSLVMDTELKPDGMVWMRVAQVRGGNLTLPKAGVSGTIATLRDEGDQEQQELIDQATGPGRLCDPQPLLSLFGASCGLRLDHLKLDRKALEIGVRHVEADPRTAAGPSP